MIGKGTITKKPDGIAFQDIKNIGSTGSAGFRKIWV
jgi:hypothetical protein